jgi:hypothetical protein
MLRGDHPPAVRWRAIGLLALVGGLAATLVAAGNPGNMGLCGACFLRDLAGAFGLHPGPAIVRPEVPGLVLGAFGWLCWRRRPVGRSGSYAASRFLLCVAMAIGALVFLGCPFRLLQRLGGGDLSAWAALPGFVLGVGVARAFEASGYSLGKTQPVVAPVGWLGPLLAGPLLLAGWFAGLWLGPGPGDTGGPPHAVWWLSLGIALLAGALLSATGFCAISAARQVVSGPRWMLAAAVAMVLGYAAVALATGSFRFGETQQPIAHADWLANTLALLLVGLCGALAGGCPVRQLVMAGEGNGDAFVGCAGLGLGAAMAHTLQLAAAPATELARGGPSPRSLPIVLLLLALVLAAAWWNALAHRRAAAV